MLIASARATRRLTRVIRHWELSRWPYIRLASTKRTPNADNFMQTGLKVKALLRCGLAASSAQTLEYCAILGGRIIANIQAVRPCSTGTRPERFRRWCSSNHAPQSVASRKAAARHATLDNERARSWRWRASNVFNPLKSTLVEDGGVISERLSRLPARRHVVLLRYHYCHRVCF